MIISFRNRETEALYESGKSRIYGTISRTAIRKLIHREQLEDLHARLVLAMPDHLHGLIAFPGIKSMTRVMADFKTWVAKSAEVKWQRDFFEHRMRGMESAAEKANYIRNNPVRAGLVSRPEDWPYQR